MRPISRQGHRRWSPTFLICLIHQTNYLLDQLIRKLEKAFIEEGGLRERMTRARLLERAKQKSR
jgi:four helix bundle suffix protein